MVKKFNSIWCSIIIILLQTLFLSPLRRTPEVLENSELYSRNMQKVMLLQVAPIINPFQFEPLGGLIIAEYYNFEVKI